MSDASTKRMIDLYVEESEAPLFLAGFFQSPPKNFHTSEKVEIDIERDDEDVAIVVKDLTAGARANESSVYTNKAFTPPIFDEEGTITSYDMIRRRPGMNPFEDPDYLANATEDAFRIFRRLERKIRRSVELMASQVLQTGALTLVDKNNVALYTLDFQMKSTHKPTVGTAWGTVGADPIKDLGDLATVVRRDGKRVPNRIVFGSNAWRLFTNDASVQKRLEQLSLAVGQLAPAARGMGATFQGWVWLGHYRFEMWTYDGFYRDPVTGNHASYVGANNVIMLSDGGRLDLSFGAIPMLRQPEDRALPFLPPRISSVENGFDLTTNAWFSEDGKHLKVSAGTRPLTIPTAIDTYACLTVA